MSSILTNQSAITALQALRMTQSSLAMTQKEISTGLKISSAADNASTWSISQTMKSDQGVLSTISDSLNVNASLLNVGTAAVNNAITVLNNIKSAVAQAEDPSADQAKILTNLQSLGKQLTSIVASASFNGLNLIDGSGAATYSIVASYTDGKGSAASSIGTISVTTQALTNAGNTGMLQTAQATGSAAATDFTNMSAADLASGTIADTLSNADKAIASLTSYSANIGATYTSVQAQGSFIKTLNDALTSGVSSLVDADMNEASTKLQALQTQQQLGVQSLSIANQNSQIIMKLFQ
jgi:flagellin